LLNADPQPAFILHGTKGSYVRARTDVQENQLQNGIRPGDPSFGIDHSAGRLTIVSENGNAEISDYQGSKSDYMGVYNAVFNQLTDNQPYPVTRDQIRLQLELLTLKSDS